MGQGLPTDPQRSLVGLREILIHLTNDSSAGLKYKIAVVWFRIRVLSVEADLCRKWIQVAPWEKLKWNANL